MVPAVQDSMEGCPPDNLNLLFLVLSALLGLFVFLAVIAGLKIKKGQKKAVLEKSRRQSMMDAEFQKLQGELYGDKLKRLKHQNTSFAASVVNHVVPAIDVLVHSASTTPANSDVEQLATPIRSEVELEC